MSRVKLVEMRSASNSADLSGPVNILRTLGVLKSGQESPCLTRGRLWWAGGAMPHRPSEVVVDVSCGELCSSIESALESHRPLRVDVGRLLETQGAVLAGVSVLLVGARAAGTVPTARLFRRVRETNPWIAIFVCALGGRDDYMGLPLLARAGADELIVLAFLADFRALAALVSIRIRAPSPTHELSEIAKALAVVPAKSVALHCLRNSFARWREIRIARRFGVTIQALNHQLRASGLPTVGMLVRLGRQYHAQELERRGLGSREEIARRLGLDSAGALARQRRRLRRTLADEGPRGQMLLGLLDNAS